MHPESSKCPCQTHKGWGGTYVWLTLFLSRRQWGRSWPLLVTEINDFSNSCLYLHGWDTHWPLQRKIDRRTCGTWRASLGIILILKKSNNITHPVGVLSLLSRSVCMYVCEGEYQSVCTKREEKKKRRTIIINFLSVQQRVLIKTEWWIGEETERESESVGGLLKWELGFLSPLRIDIEKER